MFIPRDERDQWRKAARDAQPGDALTMVISNGVKVEKLLAHAEHMDDVVARLRRERDEARDDMNQCGALYEAALRQHKEKVRHLEDWKEIQSRTIGSLGQEVERLTVIHHSAEQAQK